LKVNSTVVCPADIYTLCSDSQQFAIQTKHENFCGVLEYSTALHLVKGSDLYTNIANLSEVVSFTGKDFEVPKVQKHT
jgi:hypothetical protein